mmetsp:Transcript_4457/g.8162  ORF Transcript_4457/g.8162 Transcript_4457/m.8162 type:complete len:208 (-) Transcript_4457:196-819(-)
MWILGLQMSSRSILKGFNAIQRHSLVPLVQRLLAPLVGLLQVRKRRPRQKGFGLKHGSLARRMKQLQQQRPVMSRVHQRQSWTRLKCTYRLCNKPRKTAMLLSQRMKANRHLHMNQHQSQKRFLNQHQRLQPRQRRSALQLRRRPKKRGWRQRLQPKRRKNISQDPPFCWGRSGEEAKRRQDKWQNWKQKNRRRRQQKWKQQRQQNG